MERNTTDILNPWQAFAAPTERIPLEAANGRIAASTIRQYPPGIPEIIPGVKYSAHILDSLETAHAAGVNIVGLDMVTDRHVDVVKTPQAPSLAYDIQTFDARDINETTANEIADFFRLSFSSEPYFHFAFHESDTALYDAEKRKACQDSLRGAAFEKALKDNSAPAMETIFLPQGFHLWTDKTRCRQHIKDRLTDPGYVTLVRNPKTQDLLGLLHSRMGTIERLFNSEEWSNPLHFSQYQDDAVLADAETFYKKIDYHFGLKPHDPVMTISAQVLAPEIQGGDVFYHMMKTMALKITPEHTALPLLCEIPSHGTAHSLNTRHCTAKWSLGTRCLCH